MSIETLKSALPDYAKDLKLNLSSVAAEASLTDQQRWGALVATAIASRNPLVIRAIEAEAAPKLAPEALAAAKTAAAIMAMNNIYYRFVHLVGGEDYRTLPARLRMNALAKPGVDKADFELWSLAVSAVNGCGACLESHEKVLRDHGVAREAIQAAARIAAVVHAVAVTLEAESPAVAEFASAA
ncbi:MAG: carboxymuconolactone decarboxylase family protein [Rhodospirillaceae bacterium]|nr:carboxymuconolactone decarboxylase family protein [Rhodospirillaceae bacterium]